MTDAPKPTDSALPKTQDGDEMAVALDPPTGRHGTPPGTAAVIIVLLCVAAFAMGLRTFTGDTGPNAEDVSLQIPDWATSAAENAVLDGLHAARLDADPEATRSDLARALQRTYFEFCALENLHGGVMRHPDVADIRADYQQWARDLLHREGGERFMGMGQRIADGFVAAARAGDEAEAVRLGGSFVQQAKNGGLMTAKGRSIAGVDAVLNAAFLAHRWTPVLNEERALASLMAMEERDLLARWKLAAHRALPPARRVELAKELAAMGSKYPAVEALAARAADDGAWADAARLYAFAAQAHPDAERLMANSAYAEAMAEGIRQR